MFQLSGFYCNSKPALTQDLAGRSWTIIPLMDGGKPLFRFLVKNIVRYTQDPIPTIKAPILKALWGDLIFEDRS